jgi:hypothetical protein
LEIYNDENSAQQKKAKFSESEHEVDAIISTD